MKKTEKPAITAQPKSFFIREERENDDRLDKTPTIDDYDRIYGKANKKSRSLFSTKGYYED